MLGVALLELLPEALTLLPASARSSARCSRASSRSSRSRSWCCCVTVTRTSATCTARPRRSCLIGDAFHNFLDGAIICVAAMTSIPLGISTAIAVAAHEIPQEVGDVAMLLAAGYSRRRALMLNVLTGGTSLLGTILAFGSVEIIPGIRPYFLAVSAASLLYIAMSDLIPDLHRGEIDASAVRQVLLIAAGIGTVLLFERLHRVRVSGHRHASTSARSRRCGAAKSRRPPPTGTWPTASTTRSARTSSIVSPSRRRARGPLVGAHRRRHRTRAGPGRGRARPVVVPAHVRSDRRAAPPRTGREQGRGGIRAAHGAPERSARSPDRRGRDARGTRPRRHPADARGRRHRTDAALRARHDSRTRAVARARHRLDRRRDLRRQRRPRRGVRHRVRHGRLHGRQRGRARRRARGHAGQRALDGRRRVPGLEVAARSVRIGSRARARARSRKTRTRRRSNWSSSTS